MVLDAGHPHHSASETSVAPPAAQFYRTLPLVIRAVDRTIEITRNLVRIRRAPSDGTGAVEVLEEPVAAYRGVLRRNELLILPLGLRRLEHIVELAHTDARKTVRAYDSHLAGGTLRIQEDLAWALHLPALDETADGVVERPLEAAGRSLRTSAVLGRIVPRFDPDGPVPRGLAWRAEHGALTVYLDGRPRPEAAAALGSATLLTVLIALPVLAGLAAVAPGTASLLAMPLIAAAAWCLRRNELQQRLTVTPTAVSYVKNSPSGQPERMAIALDEVRTVRRIRQRGSTNETLVIESDSESIAVDPLRPDRARWLETFVVAAVAMAP